jgi:hypothetical protein
MESRSREMGSSVAWEAARGDACAIASDDCVAVEVMMQA